MKSTPRLRRHERNRFDALCDTIRRALHLEHLEREYIFDDKTETTATASTKVFSAGWRLQITIRNEFWNQTYEQQIRSLIHEHIHVALHPLHQSAMTIQSQWIGRQNSSQIQDIDETAAEITVDHLTNVFYDLLKDSL